MAKSFHDRLQACIGDNLAAFARRAGIPAQRLRDYLRRSGMPSAETALKIADAAGVDVRWLITGGAGSETGLLARD